MVTRTRSATSSPVKVALSKPLVQQYEPLKTFILPRECSEEARLILLDHPRDGVKQRFLFCPSKGLFEFTQIAAPPLEHSSFLFAPSDMIRGEVGLAAEDVSNVESSYKTETGSGYINKEACYFVATPFDPCFILIPIFIKAVTSSGKSLFQPLDDLLEEVIGRDQHFRHIFRHGKFMLESAAELCCDSIDAGDEKMYRMNETKLLLNLLDRTERVVANGLPPSLEERYVTRALEKPVLSIKREESTISVIDQSSVVGEDISTESFESQFTTVSSAASTVFSEISTTSSGATLITEENTPDGIRRLQRIKTAFDFIASSYLPKAFAGRLTSVLYSDQSPINFTPLNQYQDELTVLRAQALASRSLTDFSRKRGSIEDEEAIEERVEKKRRLEEEEKRKKATESRGVRDLKKVNVSGMKKMSDFFGKKIATTKVKS